MLSTQLKEVFQHELVELLKNGIMNSVRYYRSVGYFRSSVYALLTESLDHF